MKAPVFFIPMFAVGFALLPTSATAKHTVSMSDQSVWNPAFHGKRSMGDDFTPLCQVDRKLVILDDQGHVFRPQFYTEILCKNEGGFSEAKETEMCTEMYFHCVQEYATITILKASAVDAMNDCWQYEERKIPYGCSCMRPPEIEDRAT